MTGTLVPLAAAAGVYLLYTSVALGWRGVPDRIGSASNVLSASLRRRLDELTGRAVSWPELGAATIVLFAAGAVFGVVVFASPLAGIATGTFAATAPTSSLRTRRDRRRAVAHEAWPAMIEEIRVLTGSAGRSIPQAVFEVGARAPVELRPAFEAARREWALGTDFARSLAVLKGQLADPTADAACETLLVAHEVGGGDLPRQLAELAADRRDDVEARRDARAKQAGVRFARRFVLLVPLGMAGVGTTIGTGRAAYRSGVGQAMVLTGIAVVVACWWSAGRLLRMPRDERVFTR